MTAPQSLSGFTGVALDFTNYRQQRREESLSHRLADDGRQIGHFERVGEKAAVVLHRELFGAERRQAEFGYSGSTGVRVKVGEVAGRQSPSWRFEDQFLFH